MHKQLLPVDFTTGRLRRLVPADLAAFQAYRAIPELGRYQGWSPMSEPEALSFITEMQEAPLFRNGAWIQLGIADADSDLLIGDIGLFLTEDGLAGEVGFTLQPAFQGQGIATRSVQQALQLFFANTKAQQVMAITDALNTASISLLERLGFSHTETREVVFKGQACIEYVFVLAADKY